MAFGAHSGTVTCFRHDDQKVVAGSNQTLKMWNVQNGELYNYFKALFLQTENTI